MPTIFTHAVFATVLGKSAISKTVLIWFWVITALCAMIPDADVIGYSFGVERGSMFAHRGFTHSIAFALVFGAIVAFFVHKFLPTNLTLIKLFVYFSLVTFSHSFLDMLTNGGPGVALFAPLSNQRFFFPWRPVEVSPIGVGFFSRRGLIVIFSEIIWVWLPAFLFFLLAIIIRKIRKKS